MRNNKIMVYILTAVLLILALAVPICLAEADEIIPFYVTVSSGEEDEQINCWKSEENKYYVFLPSYADMAQVQIYLNTENSVSIDETVLANGMYCGDFQLDVPYDLTYSAFGRTYKHEIIFVRSGSVASMYIDTESGNMDYIHNKKGNEEKGMLTLHNPDGSIDYAGDLESINGRGNSTWEFYEKKPYSIKFTDAVDLLGLGAANKWILLANAADSSNLRNKLIYDFAEDVGLEYSPDCEWVDLYLNGEYAGLYLLTEKNEIHEQRVDIDSDGSFLVSLEYEYKLEQQNYPYVTTNAQQALRIHNYSADLEPLKKDWQSVENAILSTDSIDVSTGKSLWELIDLDSWARKYLIEEVFGNFDACFVSQYFYREGENGKIFAGPVWDYDLSTGRSLTYQINTPKMFIANRPYVSDGYESPWFYSLYAKEEFYNRVVDIYKTDFLPALKNLLTEKINSYADEILQASYMNKIRWFEYEDDILSQAEYIKDYMSQRIDFLSNVWEHNEKYYTVTINHGKGSYYSYYCGYVGEPLSQLPVLTESDEYAFIGWYYVDTDEPFDIIQPIYEDTEIYAKWQDTSNEKIKDILKLSPIAVIAMLFVAIAVTDIKRDKVTKNE